ncbi:helix-turn-helix domain-containing protein [Virgibacillus sp. Bac332]|uniref:helix-turn-helix domain-containing protein n=1 Tax=Virgibacillus sp. Bac332 TaxID=2419842 RepID=UPI0013CF206E|nr:helix-turn-helix domain-containing protein [Virgibacillus sp. Bac332]QRZ18975.1 helix-turn-helix domain-containing protein [Virgibacillus sp. AGTR]
MTHKSYSVEWKYEVLLAFKNGLTHSQLFAKYQVTMSTVCPKIHEVTCFSLPS